MLELRGFDLIKGLQFSTDLLAKKENNFYVIPMGFRTVGSSNVMACHPEHFYKGDYVKALSLIWRLFLIKYS